MPQIEVDVNTLLIQRTLKVDVPDEVIDAAKKLRGKLPASEYESALKVGEDWQMGGGQEEIVKRGAVFDVLRGINLDENFPNHDFIDRGESGGRKTSPLSVTDKVTGLSRQVKRPRDL